MQTKYQVFEKSDYYKAVEHRHNQLALLRQKWVVASEKQRLAIETVARDLNAQIDRYLRLREYKFSKYLNTPNGRSWRRELAGLSLFSGGQERVYEVAYFGYHPNITSELNISLEDYYKYIDGSDQPLVWTVL